MATYSPHSQNLKPNKSVIEWLLDSDPSIRWQVMRDLTGASAEEVAAARARVATEVLAGSGIHRPKSEK